MSAELRGYLKRHIIDHGPMDIGSFMSIALGHPRYGYYMRKDPIGRAGDFTTAPEISQMFGEMIGVWCADTWVRLGSPDYFTLAECGPGRGTLMADALRATARIPAFRHAASLTLVEISPALKAVQSEVLGGYAPFWAEDIDILLESRPVLLIANEFLDALPVRQLVRVKGAWQERMVGLVDGAFAFGLSPASAELVSLLPEGAEKEEEGSFFEVSPARNLFVGKLCAKLERAGGAALFIDYGYDRRGPGDTFQAVRRHEFCGVLQHVGSADLTAHVDFAAVHDIAVNAGMRVFGPVVQGAFLKSLGIEVRAQALARVASDKQKAEIVTALGRLTGDRQMGGLFRVMAVCADKKIELSGF